MSDREKAPKGPKASPNELREFIQKFAKRRHFTSWRKLLRNARRAFGASLDESLLKQLWQEYTEAQHAHREKVNKRYKAAAYFTLALLLGGAIVAAFFLPRSYGRFLILPLLIAWKTADLAWGD